LSGFAPTLDPVIGLQPDNQRAAIFEKPSRAAVDLAHREYQRIDVDCSDLHGAPFGPSGGSKCNVQGYRE
jgi:hypothetical protein